MRWDFLPSPLTSHLSPLTSHLSPLTSHLSPLTSHLSPLTSHPSPLTPPPHPPPHPAPSGYGPSHAPGAGFRQTSACGWLNVSFKGDPDRVVNSTPTITPQVLTPFVLVSRGPACTGSSMRAIWPVRSSM